MSTVKTENTKGRGLGSFFGIGIIAGCLTALTLGPTGGLFGVSEPSLACTSKGINASVTANTWVAHTVCDASAGEVAIASGGSCPNNTAILGNGLTGNTFDQDVWLRCSTSGTAGFYATCCQLYSQ